MKKVLTLLILFSFTAVFAESFENFEEWLKDNQGKFARCRPTFDGNEYTLCDQTKIEKAELLKLFRMAPEQLLLYLNKDKKIKIERPCTQDNSRPFCVPPQARSMFAEMKALHGQFLPLENTILIHDQATTGSIVHEYLHFLQFNNPNMVWGKRYKSERIQIQKELLQKLDSLIIQTQAIEKDPNANKAQLKPLLDEAVAISLKIKSFSLWQDLIDERNLFLLYLQFGKDFGASAQDLALARKNMGFICKRKDINPLINEECELYPIIHEGQNFREEIQKLIKKVDPLERQLELQAFLDGAPEISSSDDLSAIATKLSEYIFEKNGIQADNSSNSRLVESNILPHTVVKSKKGHCVGLSTIYLLLAEKLSLKASLIRIPNHVFIELCRNEICRYIETLRKGQIVAKDFYQKNFIANPESLKGSFYFQPLSKANEFLSSIYLSLGYIAGHQKEYDLAEKYYRQSIDDDRRFPDAYSNLAAIYSAQHKNNLALTYLKIALEVFPNHAPSLLNMCILLFQDGQKDKALEFANKAIQADPTQVAAYQVKAQIHEEKKETKKLLIDYLSILAINPHKCQIIEKALQLPLGPKHKIKLEKDLANQQKTGSCQ